MAVWLAAGTMWRLQTGSGKAQRFKTQRLKTQFETSKLQHRPVIGGRCLTEHHVVAPVLGQVGRAQLGPLVKHVHLP